MIQIENVLISRETWETRFACDLDSCKGICCREGDFGALLLPDEPEKISKVLPRIEPILSRKHRAFLKAGIHEVHHGNFHIREIAHNHPCPLSFQESPPTVLCALHASCLEDGTPLLERKPRWCALYPLILTGSDSLWTINVQVLPICRSPKNAPPVLLAFQGVLSELFGNGWVARLKQLYDVECD